MNQNGSAQSILAESNGQGNYHYSQPIITPIDPNDDNLDLRQMGNVIKQRMRLITAIALGVTTLVGLWTFQQETRYKGKFQLLIEPITPENPINRLNIANNVWDDVDYDTQIEVLRSPSVLEPIIQQLSIDYPQIDYKSLVQENGTLEEPLKITRLDKTKILEISYEDKDPQKIQVVLDKLADAYLRQGLEERQSELNQGISFVKQQLPQVHQRVNQQQEQLQKFRQRYNLLNPEQQAARLTEQLTNLETQYFDTQIKLKEAGTLYTTLQQQLKLTPDQAIANSSLSESSRYQSLLNQLQELDIQIAQESAVFLEDSPVIQTLKEKRANILPLIEQEARNITGNQSVNALTSTSSSTIKQALNQQLVQTANEIQVLQIRELELLRQIEGVKTQIQQMPLIARQYTDLQRQLEVATASLDRFLDAQETLQIEVAQKASPWQLISSPQLPEEPIYPKPQRDLALAAIAGLLLGLGAAFLADKLDPAFHSSEELKESTKLPILGLIPFQKNLKTLNLPPKTELLHLENGTNLISERKPYDNFSSFLEAFLSLNTNIRFLSSDEPLKSFVISSAAPSEGKSTVALNLAQAAAVMGQRVLLIEADLRRPQFHYWLNVSNTVGLSNVIATGIELKEAIQKVPQWENLSVLTAGNIPPDAARLLASGRMKQIMEHLQNSTDFDLIIYDTPPLLGFADAKILAAYTQGIVLVSRIGKTDRAAFKYTLDELKLSQVPLLGIIANGISRRDQNLAYYYKYERHYYSNYKG